MTAALVALLLAIAAECSAVHSTLDCPFETDFCLWTLGQKTNKFDWNLIPWTDQAGTGPRGDHTIGKGHYIHVGSSHGANGDNAQLTSPALTITKGQSKCLRFFYIMYGEHVNELNVFWKTGETRNRIWTRHGNQGTDWMEARLQLPEATRFQVVIEGVRGDGEKGDIFIDDIKVIDGLCFPPQVFTSTLDCPFETDFCLWTQDHRTDKFDWNLIPWTDQAGTGPRGDHTTGKGHYIHVGSSVGANGDNAQLKSPTLTITKGQSKCLRFYYIMYGEHVNELNVFWKTGETRNRIWTRHGNQGTDWMEARLQLPEATRFQVVIEAVRGDGEKGDIFIDDIKIIDGPCFPSASKPVTCNFDKDMCSWTQMMNDDFDWTRHQGSIVSAGTGPQSDHTSGKGYYLYAKVSGLKAYKAARIQSKTITPRLVTQCLSFWYHMHGDHIGTLNVYIKSTSDIGSPVWTRSGAQGLTWNQAAVTVVEGHTPYSVVIEAVTAGGFSGGIAIDDVLLADDVCTDTVRPTVHPGQVVRNCDFEAKSICGYTQDTMDDFDWTWTSPGSSYSTGPIYDHTYGSSSFRSGHYLYTKGTTRKPGEKARMLTPTYHDSQAMCVKVHYYMYGSMGTLNVYVKVGNNTGRPLLSRSGNHGNTWSTAETTIPASTATSASGYQVVFEVVRGSSYESQIALDDVSFTVGACSVFGDCTFDAGSCIWSNTGVGDQFDWTVGSGMTSTASTGPSVDHTLGNGQGKYLYIETSAPRLAGDRAWLVCESFSPSPNGSCIRFWYNMYGATVGSLFVYIRVPGRTDDMIWHQSGNHGNYWRLGQAPIAERSTSYSIVLEGVRGNGNTGDIAIDDITITRSNCGTIPRDAVIYPRTTAQVTTQSLGTAAFSCNFENDFCGWVQIARSDLSDWIRRHGGITGTGPSTDHTFGNSHGYYMLSEPSSVSGKTRDNARLVSPLIQAGQSCITFWYSMYGSNAGALKVYIQTGIVIPATPTWMRNGTQGTYWVMGQISVNVKYPFNVVIDGVSGGNHGVTAIDDVTVANGSCSAVIPSVARPTVTQNQTTTTAPQYTTDTKPTPKPMETTVGPSIADQCAFESLNMCGFSQDHSDNFDWTRHAGSTASSGTGPASDHTFGTILGHYMYIETSEPRRAGDVARLNSFLLTGPNSPTCLTFWYHMCGSSIGSLNVYVMNNGTMGSPIWHLTGNQGNSWNVAKVSLNTVSSNTPYQIVFEGTVGACYEGDIAIDDFSVTAGACSSDVLLKATRPTVTQKAATTTAQQSTAESKPTPKHTGTTVGNTSKPADAKCTFEESIICGFSQDHLDNFDWTRNEGLTSSYGTGPSSDHTYGTRLGHYMYIETSAPRRPNDVARLNSFILTGPTSPTCLTFWYHMYGSSTGTLSVYVMRTGARSSVWQLSGNQGNSWKEAEVSLNTVSSNTPYQIVFEGTVGSGYLGDIAIDDFNVTPRACSSDVIPIVARPTVTQNPTTTTVPQSTTDTKPAPKPTGTTVGPSSNTANYKCTFEDSNLCGFSQDHSDNFDWTRQEGSTGSSGTGPANDHTFGTRLGHYMYIETSAPRRSGDVARLDSFVLTEPTSPTCLTFWYHMYGSSTGTLDVYVLRNGTRSSVWQLSGNQGDSWKVVEVSLNTVSSNMPYQIVFEGTVGSGYHGDIAIDDFSVSTGACSSDGPTVGPSSNTADYKCSFEDFNLCGFSQDHSDNFDWTRQEGSTGSSGTGPANDHTFGTILGHYMYIETSAPRRPGDVARLDSFVLTGSTSPTCLTFWYNMYGISIGTLNVYVLRNGTRSSVWQLSGNQGDSWKVAEVSLNTVSSNTPYQIVFEGTVGSGYEGDIAIDDFSVSTGACSSDGILNATRPTVTQTPAPATVPQSTRGTRPNPKPADD